VLLVFGTLIACVCCGVVGQVVCGVCVGGGGRVGVLVRDGLGGGRRWEGREGGVGE
jgi:hypothetical protein